MSRDRMRLDAVTAATPITGLFPGAITPIPVSAAGSAAAARLVVIRTFLSFSLETEIEGTAPWRRALRGGAGTIRRAAGSALEPETPP